MAKKFNKSRKQKRNIDQTKLEKYRKEISRELGIELPSLNKGNQSLQDEEIELLGEDNDYYLP